MSAEQQNSPANRERLVVVSNRLPVRVVRDEAGQQRIKSGSGGLVTALSPVLRGRGGRWIGWAGTRSEAEAEQFKAARLDDVGYELVPVSLTEQEVSHYYFGFSNEVLWPLFHDLLDRCNFDPAYWPVYQQVNRKFARVIAETTRAQDYIWFNDYHLLLGAAMLEEIGVPRKTGFFLHIPFPPLDIFLRMPWRHEILESMLAFNLLAFQSGRDRHNFISCVQFMRNDATVDSEDEVVAQLAVEDHTVQVAALPISIDFRAFERGARSQAVEKRAWYVHEEFPDRTLILGVDRLDYTKGIPHRIRAIGNALERFPELRGKVTFIQVVVPSRADVPEYQELKSTIEQLVGEINGRFTTPGWTPVHYIYRSLDRTELLALYRTAEIALVTPLKDGMNLVAKEYCACSLEEEGVLILSEFAGAAAELNENALMVNPFDVEGVANAIFQGFCMPKHERRERLRPMRAVIKEHDVFWWVDNFLKAAFGHELEYFPQVEYFVPQAVDGLSDDLDESTLP